MSRLVTLLFATAVALAGSESLPSRLQMANELIRQGRYQQAQVELQAVVGALEQTGAPVLLVQALNNLAALEIEAERYGKAEGFYRRSVQVWDQASAAEQAAEADPRFELVSMYVQAGWLKQAEVAAAEIRLTADRRQQIRYWGTTGDLRKAQRRWAEAGECYNRAILLAGEVGDRAMQGVLWNSLGVALSGQRQWSQAVKALERALLESEAAWGQEHPTLVTILTNLGGGYLEANQADRAGAALTRARDIAERSFGESSPVLYRILMLEAKAFRMTRQSSQAAIARRRAVELQKSFAERHMVDIRDLAGR
ncbi:MAG: tetratricopeptide repeat protein [Bryobacteraceae bacterium]